MIRSKQEHGRPRISRKILKIHPEENWFDFVWILPKRTRQRKIKHSKVPIFFVF